jgi:hypothetical protein
MVMKFFIYVLFVQRILVLLGIVIFDTLFWTRGMGQSARARFIDAKSRFNKEQP